MNVWKGRKDKENRCNSHLPDTCCLSLHFGRKYRSKKMNTTNWNNDKHHFMCPMGIASVAFQFSQSALQWLCGTTTDDNGREMSNFALFGALLARMALMDGAADGFHRPLMLSAGQVQYSEQQLSTQWNMGRKRIRNLLATLTDMGLIDTCRSRVASVMTFPCLLQWETAENGGMANHFIHEQREE